jgi:hypothetical protein
MSDIAGAPVPFQSVTSVKAVAVLGAEQPATAAERAKTGSRRLEVMVVT